MSVPNDRLLAGATVMEAELPCGLARFVEASAGQWLTKAREPAKTGLREYTLSGVELPSVTQITSNLSADALYRWHELEGVRGMQEATRAGLDLSEMEAHAAISAMKEIGVGATATRDLAADRGNIIHNVLHAMAMGEEPPNPADLPEHARPWAQGAARAWLALDLDVGGFAEQIVANPSPGFGYMGRLDYLSTDRDGRWKLIDWKTSASGRIFDRAHFQTALYREACQQSGLPIPERVQIVAISDDGGFLVEATAVLRTDVQALCHIHRVRKGIAQAQTAQAKAAREAVTA